MPGDVPELTRTCDIVDPLEALAPETPAETVPIVQLKVAPVTLLFSAIFVDVALHMVVALEVVTFGVGLTVIVNV